MSIENKYKQIIVSGKRKSAVARAMIKQGNGKVLINDKNLEALPKFNRLTLEEPIKIALENLKKLDFDIEIRVKGGGEKGQIEAARVALARAIVKFTQDKELEKVFLDYDRNMIVADVRRKEACKPGDSKARAKRQSSKR